ncbi:MAG: Tat pathway signal sequence domain protein [Halochromatium sp.]|nr:Tat pathway signal sequence domain protein [Halochromatium sp.]
MFTLSAPLPIFAEDNPAVAANEAADSDMDADTLGQLGIELNKLEQVEGTCRLYFVFKNALGTPLEKLQLELVLFDSKGFIQRNLMVNAAPIAADKTSVKRFDLTETRCESVGRILINDVPAIAGPDGAVSVDVSQLELSSKSDVDLFK